MGSITFQLIAVLFLGMGFVGGVVQQEEPTPIPTPPAVDLDALGLPELPEAYVIQPQEEAEFPFLEVEPLELLVPLVSMARAMPEYLWRLTLWRLLLYAALVLFVWRLYRRWLASQMNEEVPTHVNDRK